MYTYPRSFACAYPARVLFEEGRFLEAILQRTERKLAGPGRPGTVDSLAAKVERREALRPTSLGARGWRYQLREVGTLFLPPRVPAGALAPPAAPPPREGFREGPGKPRTHRAARMRNCAVIPGRLRPCASEPKNPDVLAWRFNTSGFRVRA